MFMSFIPEGTGVLLADNRVVLIFPTENDAILFREILRDVQAGKPFSLRAQEGQYE